MHNGRILPRKLFPAAARQKEVVRDGLMAAGLVFPTEEVKEPFGFAAADPNEIPVFFVELGRGLKRSKRLRGKPQALFEQRVHVRLRNHKALIALAESLFGFNARDGHVRKLCQHQRRQHVALLITRVKRQGAKQQIVARRRGHHRGRRHRYRRTLHRDVPIGRRGGRHCRRRRRRRRSLRHRRRQIHPVACGRRRQKTVNRRWLRRVRVIRIRCRVRLRGAQQQKDEYKKQNRRRGSARGNPEQALVPGLLRWLLAEIIAVVVPRLSRFRIIVGVRIVSIIGHRSSIRVKRCVEAIRRNTGRVKGCVRV